MNDEKQHHSTHYIHRMSYSAQEIMVGTFVLSAFIALLLLLFFTVKSQNIFEEHFTIYGRLNTAEGLDAESIVQISGIEVGNVSAIEIGDDNRILVTIQILSRYHKLLRSDSKIKVAKPSTNIIGKSIIIITAGSPGKILTEPGTILEIEESSSVEDIISEARKILSTINSLVENTALIVNSVKPDDISSSINSVKKIANNVQLLTQQINSGQGALGALIYDKKIQQDISQSIYNLKLTTEQLKVLIKAITNNAEEVPMVINDIKSVISETEKTIQATQRIWPISSAMPENSNNENNSKLVDPLPAND